MDTGSINIRKWSRKQRQEPSLRVGIILNSDHCSFVCLSMPATPYRARMFSKRGDSEAEQTMLTSPRTGVTVQFREGMLLVRIGDEPPCSASKMRLTPTIETSATTAACVVVHDVVAGRGFHFEKHIDQALPGVIEMLPDRDGVVLVNETPLEDYLAGVITSEMSGDCPEMLLKAQCVAARSWLLALTGSIHEHDPFDRCNDDCCQRYQGVGYVSDAAAAAVRNTRGLALLDRDGRVVDANYSKCCGGVSESPVTTWGVAKRGLATVVDAPLDAPEQRFFPVTADNLDEYLDGDWQQNSLIYCSPARVPAEALKKYLGRVDEARDYFRWTVNYSRTELEQLLIDRLPDLPELTELCDIRVIGRGVSGRVHRLDISWRGPNGQPGTTRVETEYLIRDALHRNFLFSSAFALRIERDADERINAVIIRGAGWGHGVGMCQIGALGMALAGVDFQDICAHYFPDARLERVYGDSA